MWRETALAGTLFLALLFVGSGAFSTARYEAQDAPWLLLYHIEECEEAGHGGEHSPEEIEWHILKMESDARELAEYEAELEEQREESTRF